MRVDMDLSPFQVEVVVSSTILAAAVSSFFWGHHAMDEWGRKKTLMVASTIFLIGSVIMGAAFGPYHKGYSMLILGRIVVGVAIGLASEAGPLYISECAPPALRGKLTTLFNIAVVGGQVFAAILCGCLSYLPASYNWRIMLAFGAVPAIAQLVGFLTLPLSPTWLILKGRQEEAETVLRQIRSVPVPTVETSDGEEPVDPVHEELQAIIDEYEASKKQQHVSLWRLWTSYPTIRRAMVVGCSLWAVSTLRSLISWLLEMISMLACCFLASSHFTSCYHYYRITSSGIPTCWNQHHHVLWSQHCTKSRTQWQSFL
jgi:SP family myo-inositol transporter-like MFS transporter 13